MSNKLNEELSRIRSVMGLNEMSAGFGHGFHAGDSPGGGFKSEESMSPSISEGGKDFSVKVCFYVYDKEGGFIGETESLNREEVEHFSDVSELIHSGILDNLLKGKRMSPEMVGRVKRDNKYFMGHDELDTEYYKPSESMELFNPKTQKFYTRSGQELRSPGGFKNYTDGSNSFDVDGSEDY